jgi:hypothetical protein
MSLGVLIGFKLCEDRQGKKCSYPQHEGLNGCGVKLHSSLILTPDIWTVSLMPWERVPSTEWGGGWLGPRATLDALEKRKVFLPYKESNPNSMIYTLANHCNDCAISAHHCSSLDLCSNLDMCYSMHFHKISNTPTNAQVILLYNCSPTCFDPFESSSGLYRMPKIIE